MKLPSLLVAIAIMLSAQCSYAGPWHWIATHKEEIAQNVIVDTAIGFDVGSTFHAEANGGIETNPILGPHPSHQATIGYAVAAGGLFAGLNHYISKREPHLAWFFVGPFAVDEADTVKSNFEINK